MTIGNYTPLTHTTSMAYSLFQEEWRLHSNKELLLTR